MSLDRTAALEWYRRNRERSRRLFDLLTEESYYAQPILLRHPIVFYEGHLPAFSFNTLVKRGLGKPSIDARLELLFARGIDPHESAAHQETAAGWPDRQTVQTFADEADRQVVDALARGDVERSDNPLLERAEAVFTILEHEAMHQETLLYMWHRLPYEAKRRPVVERPYGDGRGSRPAAPPQNELIDVPPGRATLGVDREGTTFGWDNELPSYGVDVPGFEVDRHNVTNERFMEFVEAGGYQDEHWWNEQDWRWVQAESIAHPLFWEREDSRWYWRGMFGRIPLPDAWPVYVSQAEASAYARWRGARLPTEAEFQRAAYGSPDGERPHPWGTADPDSDRGVFDFEGWDPQPAGSHPNGASAWGVEDLLGNGWEWTSTPFGPFPGFRAMASYPQYSADFFDGEHFVMKGASPATARELLRPTFRNWFRSRYPYVYATFRCAKDPSARSAVPGGR